MTKQDKCNLFLMKKIQNEKKFNVKKTIDNIAKKLSIEEKELSNELKNFSNFKIFKTEDKKELLAEFFKLEDRNFAHGLSYDEIVRINYLHEQIYG
jgi:CRISPR/Cas system CMR subunit Cmr6 (Cas7 group RAMP superfamily)